MTERPRQLLWEMYASMLTIRRAEEQLADMIEAGEIGCPCHLCIGQEAIPVGVSRALTSNDTVWGGHRSHGHYLAKGGELKTMFAEILGKATGCAEGRGGSMHLLAIDVGILGTVPLVAATIPLAVGAALASKLRGDRDVAVAYFGDGAMEEGHAHESMNLAALHKLPVLFVCENNFYASHMALAERRVEGNLVKSAEAQGIPAATIDGNDALAVYDAAVTAVERARDGAGPTFLECQTFRWRGHVGASWDMDVGVRRRDELRGWLERDPIARLGKALDASGADAATFDAIERNVAGQIREAQQFARMSPYPHARELATHVYYAQPREY